MEKTFEEALADLVAQYAGTTAVEEMREALEAVLDVLEDEE